MRVSYEWLSEYVELPADPAELVAAYTRTGTEVERVERTGADFDHVVTGEVLSKEPHPDSDHMWVCEVGVGERNLGEGGEPEPLQIVCGAQNFEAGDKIVVAMEGAVLPGGFEIKRAKLRGVESRGMNCSERELGLGDSHEGIMILPADTPVGLDFATWRGLSDTVIDCEMTPNRPDCLSMAGVAVETGAILDADVHVELPQVQREAGPDAAELVEVEIADAGLCPRYTARVVRNAKIGPSPDWLAKRIIACGGRPINNVVDVTNYVMFLTGQPLHAFDLGKLTLRDGKRHIVVRPAREGETLVTLDGNERKLTGENLLITDDGHTPIALAGVMGGLDSEITDETVDVLLEAAAFSSGNISRTSRMLDLMSEASIRFERVVDREGCADVSSVAAALFESCCGAEVCPGIVDCYPAPLERKPIALRPSRTRLIAGADIPVDFIENKLTRLGCSVEPAGDDALTVLAPTNRPDLVREVDLIEEVVRLWGEGDIEPTLPAARNHAGGLTVEQRRMRAIGATLRSCGLSETSTYCFADERDLERLGMSEEGKGLPVQIIRPLVSEQSQMRRDMLPGMLRAVAYNVDHGVANVALYEIGRTFHGRANKSQPDEPTFACGVMAGAWSDDTWAEKSRPLDFFDAKGVVERLLASLRIEKVRFKEASPETHGWLMPGRGAEILAQGNSLGWVGNVHPAALANFGIDCDVVAFELSVDMLLRLAQDQLPYKDVPTLPGVSVDFAIVVDESVSAEMLEQRIASAGGKLLDSVRLFDVYRDDERVGKGKKSMAFALEYRAPDHTLTSEEVEKAHGKLVTKVCKATGGEVRS